MIDSSMLPDFIIEAAEHLEEMESSLLRLEQHHEDKEVLDEIFRSIHTIKGAAQFVGIERVSELSHKLENLLDLIRRSEITVSGTITDLLIAGKDRITLLVDELERGQPEATEIDDLVERIKIIVEGGDDATPPEPEELMRATEDQPVAGVVEPKVGSLAEESLTDEYDEELYNIFLQQLKENIPFLYAQTVELSISVDKQDVLYRCNDSIKSLKSSANYMGYEKLTQHYSSWQHAIDNAVERLSSGRMPDLAFMQDYIDEIISSFPQAMAGYVQEDGERNGAGKKDNESGGEQLSIDNALDSIFSDNDSVEGRSDQENNDPEPRGIDLDKALDSIFSDELSGAVEQDDRPGAAMQGGEFSDDESLVASVSDTSAFEADTEERIIGGIRVSDRKPTDLEYELSGDEYDQELVDIFLKKLVTDIRFIQEQIAELHTGVDTGNVLECCGEAIGRLASSANYMEYLGLTAYCENWQGAVADYTAGLSEGVGPDLIGMQAFVDEITRVYPQILEEDQSGEGERNKAERTEERNVDEIDSPVAADTDQQDDVSESDSSVAEESVDAKIVDHAGSPEEDSALFDKLTNALDVSIGRESETSSGSMNSVINEIIDGPGRDSAKEKSAESEPEPERDEETAEDVYRDASPEAVVEPDLLERVVAINASDAAVEEQPTESESESESEFEPGFAFDEDDRETELEEETEQDELAERQSVLPDIQETLTAAEQPPSESVKTADKKMSVRSSIRVDAEKIDYLMNQVGELVVSRAYFAQLVNEMKILQQQLLENSGFTKSQLKPLHEFAFRLSEAGVHLGRVSNELQEGVMKVRMLPVDQLFKRYPRLVRDLVHNTDKDVKLVTQGEETELDKMVIESISDPLIHIIRNAVDHGVETVEERLRAGKPGQGTLLLKAFHESDHIVLEVSDDGRGLDMDRIRVKALRKGLFREDELDRMSELELTRLVMLPGFSTAEKTTETSGRGVGMDVVRKNIEKLNGTVEILTEAGKGTRLRIKIPLTMAIIQALMVRVGGEKFTIPLTTVEETLRVFRHEISEIEGVDVIHLRESTMPIFRLSKIYNIDRRVQDEEKMFVVVVSTGTQELGLVVDELLGQEEVVIKPLADYLRVESGFGGATILGDGGISLILDIPELVKIAAENQAMRQEERSRIHKRKWRSTTAEAESVH